MPPVRHIFFDLDRTLWDFERNSEEVLQELYDRYSLGERGAHPFGRFLELYRSVNAKFWRAHREGKVGKDELRYERFQQTLMRSGLSDRSLADLLAEEYLRETPKKSRLMEGSVELLNDLAPRFQLHLLTNGYADTQLRKVEGTGLEGFFREIITSDRAGARKPDPRIFRFALELTGAESENAMMVGDDPEADVKGGSRAGMRTVFFDPSGKRRAPEATYRVRELRELLRFLEVEG